MEKTKKSKVKVVRDFKADENYDFYNKSKSHKFWSFLHRIFAFLFLGPYIKSKYKVRVIGKEKLKKYKNKPIITISNHINHLDIQMIAVLLFKTRKLNWITLESNLNYNVKTFILNSGGIPIPTNPLLKPKFFNQMGELLKAGEILHVCPEGSLEKNHDGIRPFKVGAFRFSVDNNVPIFPITIQIFYRGKKQKTQYVLVVNDPIFPNANAVDAKEESNLIMQKAFNVMEKSFKCEIIKKNPKK